MSSFEKPFEESEVKMQKDPQCLSPQEIEALLAPLEGETKGQTVLRISSDQYLKLVLAEKFKMDALETKKNIYSPNVKPFDPKIHKPTGKDLAGNQGDDE